MAKGGRLLAGGDHVTDGLLATVATYVMPNRREKFATAELGEDIAHYKNKEYDGKYSENISSEVSQDP